MISGKVSVSENKLIQEYDAHSDLKDILGTSVSIIKNFEHGYPVCEGKNSPNN